jgi:hypothetical protein
VEQQPKPPSTHEKLKNALAKRDFWRKAAADPAQTPSSDRRDLRPIGRLLVIHDRD